MIWSEEVISIYIYIYTTECQGKAKELLRIGKISGMLTRWKALACWQDGKSAWKLCSGLRLGSVSAGDLIDPESDHWSPGPAGSLQLVIRLESNRVTSPHHTMHQFTGIEEGSQMQPVWMCLFSSNYSEDTHKHSRNPPIIQWTQQAPIPMS